MAAGRYTQAERRKHCQPEVTGALRAHVLYRALQGSDALVYVVDFPKQEAGLGGGQEPPLDALEELELQPVFRVPQGLADRWLRYVQATRGSRDGAADVHSVENFDFPEIHSPVNPQRGRSCSSRRARCSGAIPLATNRIDV